MRRNKAQHEYRHTSLRLEKELLTKFETMCAKIGISYSTGIRWLIQEAVRKNELRPPFIDDEIDGKIDGDGMALDNQDKTDIK